MIQIHKLTPVLYITILIQYICVDLFHYYFLIFILLPIGILQERAVAAYNTANSDGSVTKNDIKKLSTQMQAKTAHCDSMKATYANQMLKVNVVILQN